MNDLQARGNGDAIRVCIGKSRALLYYYPGHRGTRVRADSVKEDLDGKQAQKEKKDKR